MVAVVVFPCDYLLAIYDFLSPFRIKISFFSLLCG